MRFTTQQYGDAIDSLRQAREQLEPDGRCCACCGDSGHQAFECGFNPLVAMAMCEAISKKAEALHESLHVLAGHDWRMGSQVGPAAVHLPPQGGRSGE